MRDIKIKKNPLPTKCENYENTREIYMDRTSGYITDTDTGEVIHFRLPSDEQIDEIINKYSNIKR